MSNRTEVNGNASLADRVKELRLTGKMESGRSNRGGAAWLPWFLCFLLAVGWAGYGIKSFRANTAKPDDNAGIAVTSGPSSTTPTAKKDNDDPADVIALEVKGYLIPTQQISISPIDVAGRVIKLNIEEGMSFRKGDILAELDPTPILALLAENKAQVAASEARWAELEAGSRPEEVAQAMAELDDAKAQLEQFRREWQRFEAQKTTAITTREYEQAEAGYRSALKRVEARQKAYDLVKVGPRVERIAAAKAELDAAKARLRQSEWKFENCTIRSPVTGVILTKKAEVGSLINPVVGGVSTNLCDIADLRKLEVDLEVQERDIARVQLYQACKIKADAYPQREYVGYVDRVMPIANRAKSVVPVRIKVIPRDDETQGQYLKPEMGVTVTFIKDKIVSPDERKKLLKKIEEEAIPAKKE